MLQDIRVQAAVYIWVCAKNANVTDMQRNVKKNTELVWIVSTIRKVINASVVSPVLKAMRCVGLVNQNKKLRDPIANAIIIRQEAVIHLDVVWYRFLNSLKFYFFKLCEHNTEGYHCETCKRGFYGEATRGTPYDCTPCPCP